MGGWGEERESVKKKIYLHKFEYIIEEWRFLQAEKDLIPSINYSLQIIHSTPINRGSLSLLFQRKKNPQYSTKAKKEILEILFTIKQNELFTGC